MISAFGVVCECMPLVTAVTLLALLAIPKRVSATARHQVLVVAALLCLAAPLLLRCVPDWQVLPRPSAPVMAAVAPALKGDDAGVTTALVTPALSASAAAAPVAAVPPLRETYRSWFSAAAILWMLGAALALVRLACNAAALRRWVRGSVAAPEEIEELAAGIPGPPVRIRIAEGEGDAFVYGALSPVIVLPASVAVLPLEQLRIILEHEMAHVRRRDPLWTWIFESFRAFYWFHPLAWTLVKRGHLAREMAADDLVLLSGREPESYAACLGAAALRSRAHAAPPLPALAFVRQHPVLQRLHAIMDGGRRRSRPSTAGWLAAGLPLAAPALVLASLGFKAAVEAQPAHRATPRAMASFATPTPSLWSDVVEPLVHATPPAAETAAVAVPVPRTPAASPLPPAAAPVASAPQPYRAPASREGRARSSVQGGGVPVSVSLPDHGMTGGNSQVAPTPGPRGFGFRPPSQGNPPAADPTPTPPKSDPGSTPKPPKPGGDPTPTPPSTGPTPTEPEPPTTSPSDPTPPSTGPDTGNGGQDPAEEPGEEDPPPSRGSNGTPVPPDVPSSPSLPPSKGKSFDDLLTGAPPVLEVVPYETDAGSHFAVGWNVSAAAAANWVPEVSPDLDFWTTDPDAMIIEGPIPIAAGVVRYIAVIREPMPGSHHRFIRLSTTPAPPSPEPGLMKD